MLAVGAKVGKQITRLDCGEMSMIMNQTDSTTTEATLEACPLSHETAKGLHVESAYSKHQWSIQCLDCGLKIVGQWGETIKDLTAQWNTRTTTASAALTVDGISWSALLGVLERLRSKNKNPEADWYNGWNAAIQCLINDINSRVATTVAPVEQSDADTHDPQCDVCGTELVLTFDAQTTWRQYVCPESGKGNKLGHTIIPVGYQQPQGTAAASLAAPQDEQYVIPAFGYERAITVEWDKHNARRHVLIEAKRTRALSDDQTAELSELQWLAGIKRALQIGPVLAAPQGEAQATVIEGPSSTEYEAWLETRPDLTARFKTDSFKRTTGYEIWRNAWLRLRELITTSPATTDSSAAKPSGAAREAAREIRQLCYEALPNVPGYTASSIPPIDAIETIIDRYFPATAESVAEQWFDLALRYMRGDPTLTNVPYSEDSVFADFLHFWDGQTFHAQCMVKSVFRSAPKFTVAATPVLTEEPTK